MYSDVLTHLWVDRGQRCELCGRPIESPGEAYPHNGLDLLDRMARRVQGLREDLWIAALKDTRTALLCAGCHEDYLRGRKLYRVLCGGESKVGWKYYEDDE